MRRLALPPLVVACLAIAPAARAQAPNYQPVRVDLTLYGAYAAADANAYGGGIALEPKLNLTDQIAVGLRLDAAGFATQRVSVGATGSQAVSVSQGARAVTAFLAKADWYLTTSTVRPFLGIGVGIYRIGSGTQSVSGTGSVVQTAGKFQGFGVCPQLGLNLGAFRVAGTYHLIAGGDQVVLTQSVGTSAPTQTKLSKSFFAIEIGGTFGGGRHD
jgi:outer membrane protein X